MDDVAVDIGRKTIETIFSRFPDLEWQEDSELPVELSFTLYEQAGLRHKVWLALQNGDELTLGISHFQCEWFPCTDERRAAEYIDAVVGWVSGLYRIREHYRGSRCVKAQLQRPARDEWQTLATWSRPWLPLPFKKTYRTVRNAHAGETGGG